MTPKQPQTAPPDVQPAFSGIPAAQSSTKATHGPHTEQAT